MIIFIADLSSTFRNTVRLVYDRVLQLRRPALTLMWRQAVLGLYGYLTFRRL